MSDNYYVKKNGRVLGPFGLKIIKTDIERGKITRDTQMAAAPPIHPGSRRPNAEFDLEQAQWARADSIAGLFEDEKVSGQPVTIAAPVENTELIWWKREDGSIEGPASFAVISAMWRHGRLEPYWQISFDKQSWTLAEEHPYLKHQQRKSDALGGSSQPASVQQIVNIGTTKAPLPTPRNRHPALAAVLSLLICGLGQVYNGQIFRGFVFFVVCALTWIGGMGWFVAIVAAVEAYVSAQQLNDGEGGNEQST